jgi:uncharacterized protein with FMN-binding domain
MQISIFKCSWHTSAVVGCEYFISRFEISTRVGPKVSGLTHKSRAKWKMLRGIYSAIYGEFNVSVSVCVEIKGDYIEK